MSWNARRQLIILLGLLTILGAVLGGVYYVAVPEDTCFDGRLGAGELGVDCGGVCNDVCSAEVGDLIVGWVKILPVRSTQYDVAAFVRNPNDRFIARELAYQFKVFDEDNILITERNGLTFAGPRDEFVVYEPKLPVGNKIPRRATIQFSLPAWERVDSVPQPTIFVRNQSFESLPTPVITAEVVNTGVEKKRDVEVSAVLMEADRNVFAVSRTVVTTLLPQDTGDILFGWPGAFDKDPVFIEIFPHYIREGLDK
ncbi:MAG: hypothetical protein Q8Q18_03205 [bacterium]|nr:hypothetical protein [bacterium]